MLKTLKKLKNRLFLDKYTAEVDFWINEIQEYQNWYDGKKNLWGHNPPLEKEKIIKYNFKDNSILTWFNVHQKQKYLQALDLLPNCFSGLRVLDIWAGPMPSAMAFLHADLYCLDPLYSQYLKAGYPLHFYGNTKFINSYSESIPVDNNFFDAIISVNAIDHVDNLEQTAAEIKRVLKTDGQFAMHVHYHRATVTEPIEINDERFFSLFNWVSWLKKIKETRTIMGCSLLDNNERYVLWKNF